MIPKTLVLCSASVLMLTVATSPAWAQTPPPAAQSAPDGEVVQPAPEDAVEGEGEVEAVVVTGLRRSLQSAQSIRRNSDQIVDSVVAEDIGKLPDVTASDSLARITGVQVSRGGGEANQVLVRGLPNVTTTYNGRDIFTAEARSVAIQDFPAGGVSGLDVFKSSSADLVESGIGGLVNVRSRRPFDFTGAEVAGSLWSAYTTQSQDWSPSANILISNRWDTGMGQVGALLNLSYTELHFRDSARFVGGGWIEDIDGFQTTDPTLVGARFSDAVGVFYGESTRSRPSMNAALQWRPNDNLELYADLLYQGYQEDVEDRRLLVPLYGAPTFSNVQLFPGTRQVRSLTEQGAVPPWMFQGATDRHTDTWQYAIGGTWTSGPWRISADLARTDSKFEITVYSLDSEFIFDTPAESVVSVNFDVPREEGGAEFSFPNFNIQDPSNYRWLGIFDRYQDASGDDVQFRTDGEYDTGMSLLEQIEFGFRFTDRNGDFHAGDRFGGGGGRLLTSIPVTLELLEPGFRGSDIQPTRQWVSATPGSIRDNIAQLRALSGLAAGQPPIDPFTVFEGNEKAYAGYLQGRYEIDLGMPIDGFVGVRVVKTELDISGTARVFGSSGVVFTPIDSQTEYTDVLPAASARIQLSDQWQARLAANKTRTRPNFADLNPSMTVDPNADSNGIRNANGGNPDLQPFEATNYDAALEYYFSSTGSATFNVFRRDISGFIARRVESVNDPVFGQLRIDRPVNLNDASLQGIEAQVTTFLDFGFLPEWAQGFGVQANFTYIDNLDDLDDVSDYTYNLVGMYEQGPISARLAYNFRSEFRDFCEVRGFGGTGCEYVDGLGRLDFSANWTPIENVTLTFQASNLTGEPFRNFREYQNESTGAVLGRYPRDVRYEETVYSLGLRFRM